MAEIIDRLTILPEDLKAKILSFVDIKSAVKTSVLSRQWKSTWTNSTDILFDQTVDSTFSHLNRFLEFVIDRLKAVAQRLVELRKVKVNFTFEWSPEVQEYINEFFKLIRVLKVKSLDFNMGRFCEYPQALFDNSILMELVLFGGSILSSRVIGWNRLTTLTLNSISFNANVGSLITEGCPSLKTFYLIKCKTYYTHYTFEIKSNSIEDIYIHQWDLGRIFSRVEITLPNLKTLSCSGGTSVLRVMGILPQISKVVLTFSSQFGQQDCIPPNISADFKHLMEGVINVQHLTLEGFLLFRTEGAFPESFPNLRTLNIMTTLNKAEMVGIVTLLKCCPRLEKLLVQKKMCKKWTTAWSTHVMGNTLETLVTSPASLPLLTHVKFMGCGNDTNLDEDAHFLAQFIRDSRSVGNHQSVQAGAADIVIFRD